MGYTPLMNKKYFYVRILADTNLYQVELGNEPFKHGEYVIINTEFGEDMGFITSFPFENPEKKKEIYKSGKLIRYATSKDKALSEERLLESRKARLKVQEFTTELELQMNITHILFPLSKESLVVFYTADGKVDFRELLKKLRGEFKEKIIMRQIRSKDRLSSFHLDARNPVNHY